MNRNILLLGVTCALFVLGLTIVVTSNGADRSNLVSLNSDNLAKITVPPQQPISQVDSLLEKPSLEDIKPIEKVDVKPFVPVVPEFNEPNDDNFDGVFIGEISPNKVSDVGIPILNHVGSEKVFIDNVENHNEQDSASVGVENEGVVTENDKNVQLDEVVVELSISQEKVTVEVAEETTVEVVEDVIEIPEDILIRDLSNEQIALNSEEAVVEEAVVEDAVVEDAVVLNEEHMKKRDLFNFFSGDVVTEGVEGAIEGVDESLVRVYEKPSYVKFIEPYTNETVNAIMDLENNNYFVTPSLDDGWKLKNVSKNIYPLEGNLYRLSSFSGWCGVIAKVEYDLDTYIWSISSTEPSIEILKNVDNVLDQGMFESSDFDDLEGVNIGAFVACFDSKINGELPFYSPYIMYALSNTYFGEFTVIK